MNGNIVSNHAPSFSLLQLFAKILIKRHNERGIYALLRNIPRNWKVNRAGMSLDHAADVPHSRGRLFAGTVLTNSKLFTYNSKYPTKTVGDWAPPQLQAAREFELEHNSGAIVVEVPICQLCPGQKGLVVRLEGESSLKQHLLEMGFTKGTEVEFIRTAPLGDPVDLGLRGYRLSLRQAEACAVIVSANIVPPKPTHGKKSKA